MKPEIVLTLIFKLCFWRWINPITRWCFCWFTWRWNEQVWAVQKIYCLGVIWLWFFSL